MAVYEPTSLTSTNCSTANKPEAMDHTINILIPHSHDFEVPGRDASSFSAFFSITSFSVAYSLPTRTYNNSYKLTTLYT